MRYLPANLRITMVPMQIAGCRPVPPTHWASTLWTVSAVALNGKPWGLSELSIRIQFIVVSSFSHLDTTVSKWETPMLYQSAE